jgi:hypothetical protein
VGFERQKKLDNTVAEDVSTTKRLRILCNEVELAS